MELVILHKNTSVKGREDTSSKFCSEKWNFQDGATKGKAVQSLVVGCFLQQSALSLGISKDLSIGVFEVDRAADITHHYGIIIVEGKCFQRSLCMRGVVVHVQPT